MHSICRRILITVTHILTGSSKAQIPEHRIEAIVVSLLNNVETKAGYVPGTPYIPLSVLQHLVMATTAPCTAPAT